MFLSKQNFIYLILLIFSVCCTRILATDCDIYKGLAGTTFPYQNQLNEVNGNCCRLGDVRCDDNDNIISVNFFFFPNGSASNFFEQLAKLPKLQEITVAMEHAIPSSIAKVTQIKKLTIDYHFRENNIISSKIGELVNLEELTLKEANFVGKIPKSFGNLVNLKRLDLSKNHLDGYVPKSLENLKNLEYLDLSGNMLKGYVPHIQNLTECKIQYNEEMCFLEDSNCGSSLEGSDKNKITQCSQQQIEIANNNNNYEDVVENETSDDNSSSNSSSNRSGFSSFNYNEGSDKSDKSGFLKTFLIVVSVGIVIVAVVFFVIYKMGNKKPKFSRFDDDNHHNRSENEIEIINNNNNVARTATVATNAATVVSGSTSPPPITYSYNYARSSVSVQAQVPSTIGGYSVYYPVPSPVPPAAQTSTYIPPSPTASYAIPVSQPEVAYLSPIQSSQHVSYVPSNVSTYASPQPENANLPTDVQSGVAQTEKDYPLPPLVGQEGLPNDVLPPYESLGRSLRHPQ